MKKILKSFTILFGLILLLTVFNGCDTKKHQVTFMSDNQIYQTVSVESGGKLKEPTEPTKDLYTFKGWYEEAALETKYLFDKAVESDFTLYAKWEESIIPTHFVTFFDWNGMIIKVNGQDSQKIEIGKTAIAPENPLREGYTFTGWDQSFTNVQTRLNVKAVYTINTYQIVFHSLGTSTTKDVVYDEVIGILNAPESINGLVFQGWYLDELYETIANFETEKMPSRNIDVYAKWQIEALVNASITSNKEEGIIYGDSVILTIGHNEISGYTYTYQWYQGVQLLEGKTSKELEVSLQAGTYDYHAKIFINGNSLSGEEVVSKTIVFNKKGLTISVNDQTITYGDELKAMVQYDGFIEGESVADLEGTLQFSGYLPTHNAGEYEVEASGLTSNNYLIQYRKGNLTVEPKSANATVTFDKNPVSYGDSVTYSLTFNGLVNGDTSSMIEGQDLIQYSGYSVGNSIGSYIVTATGNLINSNYTFEFISSTLTVNKAVLTITVNDTTVTYGDAIPEYSVTYNGFVNNEDQNVLIGSLSYSGYESSYVVGGYEISAAGLTGENYLIQYVKGNLTVEPKDLTVTITLANATILYGEALPSASIKFEGFVNGDTEANINQENLQFIGYGVGNSAGTYKITVSGLENNNYSFKFVEGNLEVQKITYSNITHAAVGEIFAPNTSLAGYDYQLDANFRWKNPETFPILGEGSYPVLYNGDPTNYHDFELNVTLVLSVGQELSIVRNEAFDFTGDAKNADLTKAASAVIDEKMFPSVPLTYSLDKVTLGGTYSITVSFAGDDHYSPISVVMIVKVKTVGIGSSWYTIEDALNTSVAGDVVIVKHDTQFTNDATIIASEYSTNDYRTVKAGVTLLVPLDGAYSTENAVSGNQNQTTISFTKYVELTLTSGLDLNVYGTINVNGKRGSKNNPTGYTYDGYGQLTLEETSKVTIQDQGIYISTGYTVGAGELIAESGAKVYDVLAISGFRGGTITTGIYEKLFPFDEYTYQNIEVKTMIKYGASFYAKYYIYMSVALSGDLLVIGKDGFLEVQEETGFINKRFNVNNGKNTFEIVGNTIVNIVTLKIRVLWFERIMSSRNLEFPIPGNFDIHVKKGTMTLPNEIRLKMLPGSNLVIDQGATLNIESNARLYVYGANEFISTDTPVMYGNKMLNFRNDLEKLCYTKSEKGTILNNGTINLLEGGTLGGAIENSSSTGIIHLAGNISGSLNEFLTKSTYLVNTLNLSLNGIEVPTTNTTYYANQGIWQLSPIDPI